MAMSNPTAFWMVWSPQGDSPTMRHATRDAADAEAERLAKANTGRQFYVLLSTTMYEANVVRRVELTLPLALQVNHMPLWSSTGSRWGGP